ncbi:uncharacterized protein LOC135391083 isoform X2 [Ornithodoros turicata]|uniref:uncharacterized protein LOC135391083 isoform X2 n=1 Tax=Ornithodoros turicata TaxID=34597 RepID=UPI00313A3B8E
MSIGTQYEVVKPARDQQICCRECPTFWGNPIQLSWPDKGMSLVSVCSVRSGRLPARISSASHIRDSVSNHKLVKIVTDPRLLRDISQLSSVGQTSSMESYHAVLIKFAPKSTACTPKVMKVKTQLAALYFD